MNNLHEPLVLPVTDASHTWNTIHQLRILLPRWISHKKHACTVCILDNDVLLKSRCYIQHILVYGVPSVTCIGYREKVAFPWNVLQMVERR